MSKIFFVKYEGAGNDFVIIDDRTASFPLENRAFIQKICQRKFGVGADGVVLLCKGHFSCYKMRIFNSDGSEAESCGNGLRCLIQFMRESGLLSNSIEVGGRLIGISFEAGSFWVNMGMPIGMQLGLHTALGFVHFVDTGVPHVVRFVSDVDSIDLSKEGAELRHHVLFQPKGVNVNFVQRFSNGSIHVRTFERGVEGETLSCGTGAVAAAAIVDKLYGVDWPISLSFRGGVLKVLEKEGHMHLTGLVKKVFTGSLESSILLSTT